MNTTERAVLVDIPLASLGSGVPRSTIRRWLSEGRLTRHGARKPYRVDLHRVIDVRDTLRRAA